MKKIFSFLGLSKEAILFDSKLYIAKAVLAIGTGYILAKGLPIAKLDMISVLFGLMCNLEPINIIGIRSGVNQLFASALGAGCTAVLMVFLGINMFTIAISMGLTIYLSLKIDWRMVSPVAIFTCIYMTQFVQRDLLGIPSIWLTFRLRIVALGFGIFVAIIFNYIFSFFYYRKIAYKRLEFAKIQVLSGLEYTVNELKSEGYERKTDYISIFPKIFNDIDLVYSNIGVMIDESKYSFKQLEPERLKSIQKIMLYFRDINHLAYDINFAIFCCGSKRNAYEKSLEVLEKSINMLKNIDFTKVRVRSDKNIEALEIEVNDRVSSNINSIKAYIDLVIGENI